MHFLPTLLLSSSFFLFSLWSNIANTLIILRQALHHFQTVSYLLYYYFLCQKCFHAQWSLQISRRQWHFFPGLLLLLLIIEQALQWHRDFREKLRLSISVCTRSVSNLNRVFDPNHYLSPLSFFFLLRVLNQSIFPPNYPSTLANSTLLILFTKMLKFSNTISFKSKNIVKENSEYLGIFCLLKWIFQIN